MGTYYPKQQVTNQPYRLNSFRLEGLEKLSVSYRFIKIDGLIEEDEDYEKKIRQVAILISGSVKMPVEPVRVHGEQRLAVIESPAKLRALEIKDSYNLTPEVVIATLDADIHPLKFKFNNDRVQFKLARKVLDWAIDKALKSTEASWWKNNRRFISRTPDESKSTEAIQVHPSFYFGFIPGADGTLELSINPSVCYIERRSLYEKYGQNMPQSVKGKRYLYRNGLEFYEIDALAVGKAAVQDLMIDPDTEKPISIQQRIMNRWRNKGISWIDELDGLAPTIAYKTKGQQSRKAHSQLLYEMVGVGGTDEGDESPHNEAIMSPDMRGKLTERLISDLSHRLWLFGVKLNPSRQMRKLNGEVKVFNPPKLRFADGEELSTNLATMGQDRFDALKHLGPAESADFEKPQWFVYPESMPKEVRIDFKKRFAGMITNLFGKAPDFQNVPAQDRNCYLLREQFNAITKAVENRRGYGLLLLPRGRKAGQMKNLHDSLKRELWQRVHTQCASVESIMSFYKKTTNRSGEEHWEVRRDKSGLYNSYLKYLALGYLEVNRKWLWKLGEGTLRNEVHVGIDVYQNLAIFTFIYGDADLIGFHLSYAKRGEKLSTAQVRDALLKNLRDDLKDLGLCPSRIVFHRDGRVFDSEIRGIKKALEELHRERLLANDYQYGIVEIHKTSASRPRLYKRQNNKFNNPEMGLFAELNSFEGILATTGSPVLRRGTAQPLAIELVDGDISLEDIAHDIYALSHLAFASPGSAMSLPFTIALADRILRESSPGKEIDMYDDEEDAVKQLEFTSRQQSGQIKKGVATV
jgi:hypothetical protein